MLYEKKVRSMTRILFGLDKISNSVRSMSDKTLEYFDSTALHLSS